MFAMPVNGYTVASALMDGLEMPKLYCWGNHDNDMDIPKKLTAAVYMR